MEYSETMTNGEYINNFKCCANCSNWNKDVTLGDYQYNTCHFWWEKGIRYMTGFAAFCDGYNGNKTNEAQKLKLILNEDNKLQYFKEAK
jgi:hypothetical protein